MTGPAARRPPRAASSEARARELAWQRRLLAAELRGIERGLITARRGSGSRDAS
jgi:hypothetical protein